jgi:importin subunit alpha-1
MSFSDRLIERKKTYKSTVDGDLTRRRREDELVQIRKKEKDEQVSRRRRLVVFSSDIADGEKSTPAGFEIAICM